MAASPEKQSIDTADVFDPFDADDDGAGPPFQSSGNGRAGANGDSSFPDFGPINDSNVADVDSSFESTGFSAPFESTAFPFPANPASPTTSRDLSGGALKGTAGAGSDFADTTNGGDDIFPEMAANVREIPVNIALHEEMSCAYDDISRTSSVAVEGTVSVKSSVALEGNPFHLTLKDSQHHIEKLSFDASFVTEVYDTRLSAEEGNRVFGATLPDYDGVPDADIEMVKYTCSSSLVPVPMLVQSKVRLAGKYVRVLYKIRSNPSNRRSLSNVVVLVAVPPDIDGETVKMSRKGGVWDAMKRLLVWSFQELKPGETLELQTQFEFASPPKGDPPARPPVPKFPALVRFDTRDDQLSCVGLDVSGGDADEYNFGRFQLNLTRSFRVLHRKL